MNILHIYLYVKRRQTYHSKGTFAGTSKRPAVVCDRTVSERMCSLPDGCSHVCFCCRFVNVYNDLFTTS